MVDSVTIAMPYDYSLYEHQNIPKEIQSKINDGMNVIQLITFK